MDIFEKAKSELAQIDGQITALRKRQEALRQFVLTGQSLFPEPDALDLVKLSPVSEVVSVTRSETTPEEIAARNAQVLLAIRAFRSAKDQILIGAAELIRKNGRPTHSREILQYLRELGVSVGGNDPATTVSVQLSRCKELFKSDRVNGWSLVEDPQEKAPPGASTPTGPELWEDKTALTQGTGNTPD